MVVEVPDVLRPSWGWGRVVVAVVAAAVASMIAAVSGAAEGVPRREASLCAGRGRGAAAFTVAAQG